MTTVLLVVALWTPWLVGALILTDSGRLGGRQAVANQPFPVLTAVAVALVAAGLVVQLSWSPWLADLERNRHAVAAGQWWRLGTSLVAQDGGGPGGLSNLLALAFVGTVAEWTLGRPRWLLAVVAGVIAGQVAGLVLDVNGAGNSIAVVALGAALSVDALLMRGDRLDRVLAAVALLASLLLVAQRDIHGFAALGGVVVGLTTYRGGEAPGARATRLR
jgi:rhomboid protease GluP